MLGGEAEADRPERVGIRLPLAFVLGVCAVVVGCVLMMLFDLGKTNAEDGVNDVASSLRSTIVRDAERSIYDFLNLPFVALQRPANDIRHGSLSIQRQDAYEMHPGAGERDSTGCTFSLKETCAAYPALSGLYLGNEYGHFCSATCKKDPHDGGAWGVTTMPPMSQVRKGVPTWTIPCRYREDCAASALNATRACEPQPLFAGLPDCTRSQAGCRPAWATHAKCGSGCSDPASSPCYAPDAGAGAVARWAPACNPASVAAGDDAPACRVGADGPRPYCDKMCPEFNRTYYSAGFDFSWLEFSKTRTNYDPRGRGWYKQRVGYTLPDGSVDTAAKWYTSIYVCASSGMPCITAAIGLYTPVPVAGAVVVRTDARVDVATQRAVVVGTQTTLEEMHAVRIRTASGAEEVVPPHLLRLACESEEQCRAEASRPADCEHLCANEDTSMPVTDPAMQRWDQRLIGVVEADYESGSLKDILDSIKVGKTGGIFIVEKKPDAFLIGTSLLCNAIDTDGNGVKDNPPVRMREMKENGEVGEESSVDPQCFTRQPQGADNLLAKPKQVSAFDPWAGPAVSSIMRSLFWNGTERRSCAGWDGTAEDGCTPTDTCLHMGPTGCQRRGPEVYYQSHAHIALDTQQRREVGGYWVDIVPINPKTNPQPRFAGDPTKPLGIENVNWLLFVVLPVDDYMLKVEEGNEQLLTVSVVLTVFIVCFLLVVGVVLIMLPIYGLIRDFNQASNMDLDGILARQNYKRRVLSFGLWGWGFDLPKHSVLLEIAQMQVHFLFLVRQLKYFRAFLPQTVLVTEEIDMMSASTNPLITSVNSDPIPAGSHRSPEALTGNSALGASGKKEARKSQQRVSAAASSDGDGSGPHSGPKRGSNIPGAIRRRHQANPNEMIVRRASLLVASLSLPEQAATNREAAAGLLAVWCEKVLYALKVSEAVVVSIAAWEQAAHILASWNTHAPKMGHAQRACLASISMTEMVSGEPRLPPSHWWSVCCSSGAVLVGNAGSELQRAPVVLGEPARAAQAMTSLCRLLRVRAAAEAKCYEQARSMVRARVVDAARFRGSAKDTLIYELLLGENQVTQVEAYVKAFAALRQGQPKEALEQFKALVDGGGRGDYQAHRLYRISRRRAALPEPQQGEAYSRRQLSGWCAGVPLPEGWDDVDTGDAGGAAPPPAGPAAESGKPPPPGVMAAWGGASPSNAAVNSGSAPAEGSHDSPAKREPSGMTNPRTFDGRRSAEVLRQQIEEATAGASSQDDADRGLPTEVKDSRGRTWHRSDKRLGQGAFGAVWLGMGADGEMIALKTMKLPGLEKKMKPDAVPVFAGLGGGDEPAAADGGWTVAGDGGGGGGWTVSGAGDEGGGGGGWTVSGGGGGWTAAPAAGGGEVAAAGDAAQAEQDGEATSKEKAKLAAQVEELVREVALMEQLEHDNIVQYMGSAVCAGTVLIIMEYLPGGSLHGVLHQFSAKLPISSMQRYIRDCLEGLEFLHGKKIIHRDMKLANVLVTIEGVCKLCDFGASAELAHAAGVVGTPWYMSPEAAQEICVPASDVWAIGIMLCELFTGKVPWGDRAELFPAAFMVKLAEDVAFMPDIPAKRMPDTAHEMAAQCLQRDHTKRPTAEGLLSHPFLLSSGQTSTIRTS